MGGLMRYRSFVDQTTKQVFRNLHTKKTKPQL